MPGIFVHRRIWLFVVIFQLGKLLPGVQGFSGSLHLSSLSKEVSSASKRVSKSVLFATKKNKKKGKKGGGGNAILGGFGGASMAPCPCGAKTPGSDKLMSYSACCSKVHKDVQSFRKATAAQIVLARYAAYSKKLPEFLMMSTHPNNAAFNPDLRAWKESIKVNMYDNFDLEKCIIVEEKYDETDDTETETATVKFIAEMVLRETGEKTSFMETSKFEKAKNSGAWLYLSGEIEEAPGDDDDDGNEESTDDDKSVEEKLASKL